MQWKYGKLIKNTRFHPELMNFSAHLTSSDYTDSRNLVTVRNFQNNSNQTNREKKSEIGNN